MKKLPPLTYIKQQDAALLREGLAWCYKISPPNVQKRIHGILKRYALEVAKYCECPERVYIKAEGKFACLDCGERHESAFLKALKTSVVLNEDVSKR